MQILDFQNFFYEHLGVMLVAKWLTGGLLAPFIAEVELGTLEHSPVIITRVATCGVITAKSRTPF